MSRSDLERRRRMARYRDWLLFHCPAGDWTHQGLLWLFRLASPYWREEEPEIVLARYLFRGAQRGLC